MGGEGEIREEEGRRRMERKGEKGGEEGKERGPWVCPPTLKSWLLSVAYVPLGLSLQMWTNLSFCSLG